jgi:type I restriction enzyme M protein
MLDQETKKRIDDCRNILVGKVPDPKSQVEQITIAMIYKFMYDMDLESMEMGGVSTYFVGEYEKYSWGNIFNPRIGGNEMIALYGEGIVKMNLNPNIPQLFRDIFKNAYLPYRDPETLKLFLKGINEFHYSHSEKLGDAFEYLLSILGSQGDAGQFRTPRHIIDFVVELLQPKKNERILDPACGTSGFLISSYKHILRNNTKKNLGDLITPDERNKLVENISGYDISPDMVRLSLVNLYLHNFSNPKIYEYDSLTSEDRWNEYYDVILANPPFMSPKGGIKPHKRFSIQSNRAEVLFVDYIMEHLTPKGRSGIIVPEGIIFQSGTAYRSLRKSLLDKYLVGVISLPSGVFNPYSGVKTSILILDKELSQKTDKIFFGKVDNDGFDLGSQRREIEKNDLPILAKEVADYLEGLRKGKVVESEKLTYVPKEKILESSDIGLSYDRYTTNKVSNTIFPKIDLRDLIVFERGLVYSKKDEVENDGIKVLRANNIDVLSGKVNFLDVKMIDKKSKVNERQKLKKNDIFICVASGSKEHIGKVSFIEDDLDCYFGGFMGVIRVKDSVIPKYMFYQLRHQTFNSYLRKRIVGASINNINSTILNEFNIPLPPIEVQEEIVRELEQYQKIIDGAKQVVDNYKPVIDIDPSWEMKELGVVCDVRDGTHDSPTYENEGFPLITSKNIKNGEIDFTNVNYISKIDLEKINKRSKVDDGDIIMPMIGTIGSPIIVKKDRDFAIKNVALIKFNNKKILNSYIHLILLSPIFDSYILQYSKGSTQKFISLSLLREMKVYVPSLEIQKSIVERIESERQIIEGNKKLIKIYTQKIQDRINKIWGE